MLRIMQTNPSNSFLNEKQLSQQLNVSLSALRKWRVRKRGPRFRKLGRSVRYSVADLAEWLIARPTGGEGDDRQQGAQ
jgi:predicted DNA-binding transcriptional regulator AlpA